MRYPHIGTQKTCDFTLVEMLVVVAIIAILAALLTPMLQNALESARTVVCSNNLKQHGTAIVCHSDDHSGNLPYWINSSWTWAFHNEISVYSADNGILYCPSLNGNSGYHHGSSDYGCNSSHMFRFQGYELRISAFKHPSQKVAVMDAVSTNANTGQFYAKCPGPNPCNISNDGKPHARHLDYKVNIIYLDNHTKLVPWEHLRFYNSKTDIWAHKTR